MTIRVELRAGPGFESTLPGGEGASAVIDLDAGVTLAEMVEKLDLDGRTRFLTAVNDDVVVAAQRADRTLADGDVVDILPPLTGG